MPPRKKLCVPTQGKWNPVSIFFVPQPPKTNDEQVAERAEAEERKLRANEAKDRIKSVLKSLRIDAAAAESRSAGRPAAQQLWEDGLRGYVALVENGQATKHGEYVVTVPKDWARKAKTTSCICSTSSTPAQQMWWIPPLQFNTRPLNGTSTETRSSAWRMPPSSPCTMLLRLVLLPLTTLTWPVKKKILWMPRWWRQTSGATLPPCCAQCAAAAGGEPLVKLAPAGT